MELTYKLEASSLTARRPTLYLVSISGARDGRLLIKLPCFENSRLLIDGRRYRPVAGKLLLSCEDLPDGLIAPKLSLENGVINATPFMKSGDSFARAPISEEDYAELRALFAELEVRLDRQEAKIASLEERIKGRPLFNFYKNDERKENEETL